MSWQLFIQLLAQVGVPLADKLLLKWNQVGDVTQAEWDQLKVLSSQSAQTQMLAALARAGIDPNSDQGKKLLGLVQ